MKITVWTLTIDHKHGVDTTVHATEAEAWAQLREQFIGDELWINETGAQVLVTASEPSDDLLSEYLTNGYNEVSFYGPDNVTLDVPVQLEIIHGRDPDGECDFSYYVNGERLGNDPQRALERSEVQVHTIDPGRGYEFRDWAGQAAGAKANSSPAAWAELEQYYADPCGDEYLEGMPDDENAEWLDHLDDTPENRTWWTANHPNVPLNYLF